MPDLLLACDYVEFDHSGNVVVQTDVGLVGTDRLDVCRQFNLALVDAAKASGLNSVGHVALLDGAEQASGLASLDNELDRLGGECSSLLLSVFQGSVLAGQRGQP
jgi:hypothetical protein